MPPKTNSSSCFSLTKPLQYQLRFVLVYQNKLIKFFFVSINVCPGDIKPPPMQPDLLALHEFPDKWVARYMLHLLKDIDLRDLV